MERRAFLQRGLVGGAVLWGAGCLRAPPAVARSKLAVLTPDQAATLAAVAARIVAPLDAAELKVVERIDALLAGADELTQADVRQLLSLFESPLAGLLFDGRPHAFSTLDPAAQDAALIAWRDSRLLVRRSGFQALQRLCLAVSYTNPAVYAGIHYPGPPRLYRSDGSHVGGAE